MYDVGVKMFEANCTSILKMQREIILLKYKSKVRMYSSPYEGKSVLEFDTGDLQMRSNKTYSGL